MKKFSRVYDLEERTAKFGEDVLELCKQVKINHLTASLVKQLLRSATSIGANYAEANNASSKKDFRNKIFICKKEAKETQFWLRILAKSSLENSKDAKLFSEESHELVLIFQKITNSLRNKF